jgi:hypothetical protein
MLDIEGIAYGHSWGLFKRDGCHGGGFKNVLLREETMFRLLFMGGGAKKISKELAVEGLI